MLAPHSVAPGGKLATRDIACHFSRRVAIASDHFASGRHAAHPSCALAVVEMGAARGSGSMLVVCVDGRPDAGYDLHVAKLLRDLAAEFDGDTLEGVIYQRRISTALWRAAEINGDILLLFDEPLPCHGTASHLSTE